MTITFVTSREPRELKNYLRDVYHYRLTEKWPGITLIEGDMMPIQIINRKKLSSGESRWLAGLGRGLDIESVGVLFAEAKKAPREAPIRAYLYMLAQANDRQVEEVLGMRGDAIIDNIFIELGAAARWETKGKAEGKVEDKIETARIMKEHNEPVSKIALYTGLKEEQIAEA
ncbi:hypothetical protein LQZ19_05380 [Treponema primitia]|uniref:hypothetical protein n=1 Tax=Treponema primitia TaxID=88058 RepID=UPI00397F477E